MKKEIELYIHIPFCVKKCAYCDFLSAAQDDETIDKYVNALVAEIGANGERTQVNSLSEDKEFLVTSVFLGGGTPSILYPEQIERIFKALRENFEISKDAEISMEANPGTVTREKLHVYKQCGINRISFGLQSANNEELKLLGRIHTYEEFLESYRLARECGFDNINVDLISAIPKQTLQSFEETLQKIIALNPEHISAYSLIVEEGTPFAEIYGEGCLKEKDLPSEEEERAIYQRTKELLEHAGYHRYEISNYAKAGKECKHNLGYWERKEYLGLGLGAASLQDNIRYRNTDDLNIYLQHSQNLSKIREEEQILSLTEQMEEFLFLGLRKMEGVSEMEFRELYGQEIDEQYGTQITRFVGEGLLKRAKGRLKLTEAGIDVSNYVFAEFLE